MKDAVCRSAENRRRQQGPSHGDPSFQVGVAAFFLGLGVVLSGPRPDGGRMVLILFPGRGHIYSDKRSIRCFQSSGESRFSASSSRSVSFTLSYSPYFRQGFSGGGAAHSLLSSLLSSLLYSLLLGSVSVPGWTSFFPAPGSVSVPGWTSFFTAPGSVSVPGWASFFPAPGSVSAPGRNGVIRRGQIRQARRVTPFPNRPARIRGSFARRVLNTIQDRNRIKKFRDMIPSSYHIPVFSVSGLGSAGKILYKYIFSV